MAKTRGVQLNKPGEEDDIPLVESDDGTPQSEDALTEEEILTELHKTEDDSTYILHVSRVLGPSRHGIGEPQLAKGDARLMMPTIYETLRGFTKPGEIGTYRLRITRNGRFWRKFDVSVERPAEPVPTAEAPKPATDLSTVLAAFQQSQDRMLALIEQRLNAAHGAPSAPVDVFGNVEKLVTVIKALSPPAPAASPDTGAALFAAFKSGIEVMKDSGPSDSKGVFDVIDSLLRSPIVAAVAHAMTHAQPAQPPAPVPLAGPRPPSVAAQQPPAPPKQKPSIQEIMRMFAQSPQMQAEAKKSIDYLTALASRDADTETYAFWVCDNWRREFIELLLDREDSFALVCAINQEAQAYQPWYAALVNEIRKVLKEHDTAENVNGDARGTSTAYHSGNDPGRASGDAGDFEADGEPS